VEQGVVTLRGQVERASTIPILVRMVYGVEGVVDVVNRLSAEVDDTRMRPVTMTPWGVVPHGAR
jgi:osmotically-inducible protein OsmY